jgi:hypothetical protein
MYGAQTFDKKKKRKEKIMKHKQKGKPHAK